MIHKEALIEMDKKRLRAIEETVLDCFHRQGTNRLLAKAIFDGVTPFSNADLVRAFEDLEKKQRLLVRYTEEGDDWLQLTPAGARAAGVADTTEPEERMPQPHPPKSST
jgi:hypothetical protein